MLFLGLFLVSILAVHSNAVPAEPLAVREECEGKTFCGTKPANYPQKDVDRIETQKLDRVRRLPSISTEVIADDSSSAVEICASTTKVVSPYSLTRKDVLNGFEIEFLEQNITETSCVNEGEPCLDTDDYSPRRICSTKIIHRHLFARTKENKLVEAIVVAKVDCVCELA